jgi:signal transduction histidine kinase
MDKRRFRRWLLVFFLALLLPAALLIQQSYSRLKWETFHQYQKMASELSQRIDDRLVRLIANEDKRSFADYSFLNAASDEKTNLIRRSPLSSYPIDSEIPGVLGYFQVDAEGELVTPLVPPTLNDEYGLIPEELSQRIDLQNKIQQILAANELVKPSTPILSDAVQNNEEQMSLADDALETESMMFDSVAIFEVSEADIAMSAPKDQLGASISKAPSAASQPTIAFEQLKERSKQVASKNNYARIEDITLKQNFQQKSEQKKRQKADSQRFEAASQRLQKTFKKQMAKEKIVVSVPDNKQRISTFSSEIDPFEFSQLDSGHFVLFRKVWLNGQRYTQGLILEQEQFLSIIKEAFFNTGLSQMSSVLIAYQGNLLSNFSEFNQQNYSSKSQGLVGEELFQYRFSDPLSDLQMIYSITELPVGPGGRVILWLALIMASVLLGGFYLMYRLGIGQINLANQQQDFISAISHELKTPLTSIRMYGEILKQGWASEEKKRHYYDFIYDESERLSRLINNVLQLARMNRNEQDPQLTTYNVANVVREIQAKITSQVEAANFKLTVESDTAVGKPNIKIDQDWLIQVMINLVDNALKFSAKTERKEVILRVSLESNKRVLFTVSDFGPGIEKQQMKAIFKLFYRTENELTRDTVGTGIGLSLVKQLVTSMGGEVAVQNRVALNYETNKPIGADFTVSFPSVK